MPSVLGHTASNYLYWAWASDTLACYKATANAAKASWQVAREPLSKPTNDSSNNGNDLVMVAPFDESTQPFTIWALDNEAMHCANRISSNKVSTGGGAMVEAVAGARFFNIRFFLVVFLASIDESMQAREGQRLHYVRRASRTTSTSI